LRFSELPLILDAMSRALVTIVWLAACNPILDLDETIEVASDQDLDQVHDFADNCPQEYNPDQVDADNDGFGDNCDSCPKFPPTHDFDGDGIDDACDELVHDEDGDNCPATRTAVAEPDADADGIGAACDLNEVDPAARLLFEAFHPPSEGWLSRSDDGWHESDDAVVPTTVPAFPDYALWERRSVVLSRAHWYFEAGIALPSDLGGGDEIGIGILRSAGPPSLMCFVGCDAGSCRVSLISQLVEPMLDPLRGSVALAPGSAVQLRLTAKVVIQDPPSVPPVFDTVFRCEILGGEALEITNFGQFFVWPTLVTNRPAELTYATAVQSAL